MTQHAYYVVLAMALLQLGAPGVVAQGNDASSHAKTASLIETGEKTAPSVWWGRLKFETEVDPNGWAVPPAGDIKLLIALRKTTSSNIPVECGAVPIEDLGEMCKHAILFMSSDYAPVLTKKDRANLREYLLRGGFLFADDCVDSRGQRDIFFMRMLGELRQILPEAKIIELPPSHPIFHVYYDFPDGLPKIHADAIRHPLTALEYDNKIVAVLSSVDLHCAWHRGFEWFDKERTDASFKLGINIVIYAAAQP